jgi:hypothetical protein
MLDISFNKWTVHTGKIYVYIQFDRQSLAPLSTRILRNVQGNHLLNQKSQTQPRVLDGAGVRVGPEEWDTTAQEKFCLPSSPPLETTLLSVVRCLKNVFETLMKIPFFFGLFLFQYSFPFAATQPFVE